MPRLREVYVADDAPHALPHPETGRPLPPEGARRAGPSAGDDPASGLADWLVRPDNPFFARAFVNRVWAHYFGAGLVDPVDDFSVANPPSNAQLLDVLAADFVRGTATTSAGWSGPS